MTPQRDFFNVIHYFFIFFISSLVVRLRNLGFELRPLHKLSLVATN